MGFEDLTGRKYGEWEVLGYLGNNYWNCRCSCGEIRKVLKKTLINGSSKSCGHTTNRMIDITGQHFGDWTVVKYIGDQIWECLCSCGEIRNVTGYDLRKGNSKSCGHAGSRTLSERNSAGRNKLEGMTFGEWEVIEYVGNKRYRCRCSCGKEKVVATSSLTMGASKSCGHNNGKKSFINLEGTKIGKLTVEKYIGNKSYMCRCECGNISIVYKQNLMRGTQSCGCGRLTALTKDYLEGIIRDITEMSKRPPFIKEVADSLNRNEGDIARRIRQYNLTHLLNVTFGSNIEKDVYNIIDELDKCVLHDRKVLNGAEIDVYIPSKRIAIEVNGDYWHSTLYKDKNYHQNKTIACAKQGVRLIHIFEHEWNDIETREKLMHLIKRCILADSITECEGKAVIKEINSSEAANFLNKYHLHGNTVSDTNIGYYRDSELLGVMVFDKSGYKSKYEWELKRLAWKNNVSIVNGTQKMFEYFVNNYNPTNIVTYCDISKFTGNIYTRLGFKSDVNSITSPNYKWINIVTGDITSEQESHKQLLIENKLGTIEETEDITMYKFKYVKVYDSGHLKLVWERGILQ